MAALPSVENFERDLSQMINGKLDKAFSAITERFKVLGDSISNQTGKILNTVSGPFVSMGDAIKINTVGKLMERVRDKMGGVAKLITGRERKGPLETLSEITKKGFDKTVEALEKLDQHFKDEDERKRQEDEKVKTKPDNPKPEPDKKPEGVGGFIKSFFLGIKDKFVKALPLILKGVSLVGIATLAIQGIVNTLGDFLEGEFKASENGANKIAGGMRAVLAGVEGNILSRISAIGRWTAVGATLGVAGGIPGIIAGGMLGSAVGAVVVAIDIFFKDQVELLLDHMVDGFTQAIEVFRGGDIDRIQGRIDDMKNRESRIVKEIEKTADIIDKLKVQIQEAQEAGNSATFKVLRRQLVEAEKSQEENLAKLDANTQRMESFQRELRSAEAGFMDRVANLSADFNAFFYSFVPDSITQWIREKADGVMNFVSASKEWIAKSYSDVADAAANFWKRTFTDPFNEFYPKLKEWAQNAYETVYSKISENVNGLISFFTEDIPNTISEFIDGVKQKLKDSFQYIKELGKAAYDEISFSDFNPFSEGPSYSERISKRMEDNARSTRIRENSAAQNSNAEQAFQATNDSLQRMYGQRPFVQQNNANTQVNNSSFHASPLGVRDRDPASIRDMVLSNGLVINP